MEFIMGTGGLPAGAYAAVFFGAEPYAERAEYGPGVSLKWRVIGSEFDGQEATRICGAKLTPKSTLSKFATALKGSAIAPGERFSFAPYVGTAGTIIVEATDTGGSRISTFLRQAPPTQATPSQAVDG